MENVKNNYKSLLLDYSEAAQVFEKTGRTKLLSFALGELERFERAFLQCYTIEQLLEIHNELGSQGLLTV